MTRAFLVGFVALLAASSSRQVTSADDKPPPKDPFASFDAAEKKQPEDKRVPVPDGLREQYRAFVKAIPKVEAAEDVRPFCLPHAVEVTTKQRAQDKNPAQDGMNLPYLKTKFSAEVVLVRKDSADCYLIRTATTALFYVNTRSEGWKIWCYSDSPIQ